MGILTRPDQFTTISLLPLSPLVKGLDVRKPDYRLEELEPPADRWVTPDDLLAVFCRNSKVGLQIQCNARMWTPGGDFVQYLLGFTPTADRSINVFGKNLYYGYLVSVNCYAVGATQGNRGQTYAAVNVVRPPILSSLPNWGMGTDYLTGINQIQWPHSRLINSTEGPGVLLGLTGTTPAAGVDWAQAVPTNARWKVRGIMAQLTTSAAAGNRQVQLNLAMSGLQIHQLTGAVAQAPGTIQTYSWVPGEATLAPIQAVNDVYLPADMFLGPGGVFQSSTVGLAAGDQWSGIRFEVEEWIED